MAAAIPFYDTHAHLDFPDFREDLPAVLERATAAGKPAASPTRMIQVVSRLDGQNPLRQGAD